MTRTEGEKPTRCVTRSSLRVVTPPTALIRLSDQLFESPGVQGFILPAKEVA